MPYKNIIYVKLFLEILDDDRWILQCNERQQILYIKLLLLAGRTTNKVPKSLKWLKLKSNYRSSYDMLKRDIAHLLQTFPKFCETSNCFYFKNFKRYIPYIMGTPTEKLWNSEKTPKVALDKIRLDYIRLKKWKEEDLHSDDYGRIHKAGKTLFFKARKNLELVKTCIEWVSNRGYCDWTLETCIKKWSDFLKYIEVVQAKDNQGKEAQERFQKMKEEAVKEGLIPKEKLDTLIKQAFDKR